MKICLNTYTVVHERSSNLWIILASSCLMGEKTLSASERPGQEYMDRLVKVNVELLLGPEDARVRAFPFVAFRQLAWLYQEY